MNTLNLNVTPSPPKRWGLTARILLGMLLGILVGFSIRFLPLSMEVQYFLVEDILKTGGTLFINVLKMLVVPVVLVSLICGSCSLDVKRIGRVGAKTLVLYLFTTALAIALAIALANLFAIGEQTHLPTLVEYKTVAVPSLKDIFTNFIPSNPFMALAKGEMLQVIIFSILFGMAISYAGQPGQRIAGFFQDMNDVVMRFILLMLQLSPYGIFCLIAVLCAQIGFDIITQLLGYFLVVLIVLMVQLFIVYSTLLRVIGGLNPLLFFKKFYPAMLFAFGTSSSNASIPVVLETVEQKLGVRNSIASFIIPLGATINMDGTAIMQGVATVFIAHIYHVDISLSGYLMVILMATLASIGTAGVPSVGLITLAMVLKQVNVPVEGIALIIGVDRLLDMARTVVNVSGDAAISCIVAKSERALEESRYNDPNPQAVLLNISEK